MLRHLPVVLVLFLSLAVFKLVKEPKISVHSSPQCLPNRECLFNGWQVTRSREWRRQWWFNNHRGTWGDASGPVYEQQLLRGIVHYGNKIRMNWLSETPEPRLLIPAASVQARARPSLRQTAKQAPHRAPAAKPTDASFTSHGVAMTSPSENPTVQATATAEIVLPAMTHNTLSTNTDIHTPVNTLAPHTPSTASTRHTSITAATLGPTIAPGSRTPTAHLSTHSSVSRSSTLGHTTGTHTQSSHHAALSETLSPLTHTSIASETPAQTTHTTGPTPTAHNATQPAPSTGSAPGPTMAPQPSTAKTGSYQVLNGSRLCIKAEMGLEMMVQDLDSVFSPKSYFSIDPNTTQASGNCGFRKSNLLVNFPGGFVNLTFTKDDNSYYISEVRAYLTISNPEKSYSGLSSSLMLFEAVLGHSFKCVSEQSVQLSRHLQLKMMNTQLQAFDFEGDHFGNADDCFSDTSRRETPVAVGLSIAVLFVILLSACLVGRKKPVDECSSDYTVMLPVIGAIVLGLCAVGLVVYGIRLRRESSGYQRI